VCPEKVSPLKILKQQPRICTESDKISHRHNVTSIWVTDTKFHRNPSLCVRHFHFFHSAVTDLCFQHDLLTQDVINHRSSERTTDWRVDVTLTRTLLTQQWISGVINCVNVSVWRGTLWTSDLNSWTVSSDINCIWKLLAFSSVIYNLACL